MHLSSIAIGVNTLGGSTAVPCRFSDSDAPPLKRRPQEVGNRWLPSGRDVPSSDRVVPLSMGAMDRLRTQCAALWVPSAALKDRSMCRPCKVSVGTIICKCRLRPAPMLLSNVSFRHVFNFAISLIMHIYTLLLTTQFLTTYLVSTCQLRFWKIN